MERSRIPSRPDQPSPPAVRRGGVAVVLGAIGLALAVAGLLTPAAVAAKRVAAHTPVARQLIPPATLPSPPSPPPAPRGPLSIETDLLPLGQLPAAAKTAN
jgi:hypothetical protein